MYTKIFKNIDELSMVKYVSRDGKGYIFAVDNDNLKTKSGDIVAISSKTDEFAIAEVISKEELYNCVENNKLIIEKDAITIDTSHIRYNENYIIMKINKTNNFLYEKNSLIIQLENLKKNPLFELRDYSNIPLVKEFNSKIEETISRINNLEKLKKEYKYIYKVPNSQDNFRVLSKDLIEEKNNNFVLLDKKNYIKIYKGFLTLVEEEFNDVDYEYFILNNIIVDEISELKKELIDINFELEKQNYVGLVEILYSYLNDTEFKNKVDTLMKRKKEIQNKLGM